MSIIGVIPARYASSRFPGKPLAFIAGKPMIQWVYERSKKAKRLDQVVVATDDQRIFDIVQSFGHVVMTSNALQSGTDRVAAVVEPLDVEIAVNIQGDEPLIEPEAIDQAVESLKRNEEASMSTLARQVIDPAELDNPDTAWVVLDRRGYALYFSRATLPVARDVAEKKKWLQICPYYDHIGLYAFRKEFLLIYKNLTSVLEQAEKLEQLRALENGYKIKVEIVDFESICVDKPEHIARVEKRIGQLNAKKT